MNHRKEVLPDNHLNSSGMYFIPLELYIHIPFCVKKCDYCDFLSAPADEETQDSYFNALLAEIGAQDLPDRYCVVSIFFGGGTPSVPNAEQIARVMRALRKKFRIREDAEITMEANPGTLTEEKLRIYRSCGVNRLSLGLQSTDDRELKLLGRIHSYQDFLDNYQLAREAGFTNINVDLISAIPEQTQERWADNLRRAAELSPEHISAYSLIVEEGTPFAQRELNLPDEDTEYRMYEDTASILAGYGYEQYEISNYAKPGYACRHNLGYWKRTRYLGFGLGAASFIDADSREPEALLKLSRPGADPGAAKYSGTSVFPRMLRYSNTRDLKKYIENSRRPETICENVELISRQTAMEEFMFLGLRMTDGISAQEFERQFAEPLEHKYGSFLRKYEKTGHLERVTRQAPDLSAGNRPETFWRLTRTGIHVSNWILADVLE